MTDHPILFSGPMIRALLDGKKTQTRRALKPQPRCAPIREMNGVWNDSAELDHFLNRLDVLLGAVPYATGDRLWVREAWRTGLAYCDLSPSEMGGEEYVFFESDGTRINHHPKDSELGRLRAAMHMPRWASRLTLTVTDVRVQRVQEISEQDAYAEGAPGKRVGTRLTPLHVPGFQEIWDSLNASRGFGWADNPWVAAYTFTVHHGNIDQGGA